MIIILQTPWHYSNSLRIFLTINFSLYFASVVPTPENRLRVNTKTNRHICFSTSATNPINYFLFLKLMRENEIAKVWKFAREIILPHRKHLIFDSARLSHFTHFFRNNFHLHFLLFHFFFLFIVFFPSVCVLHPLHYYSHELNMESWFWLANCLCACAAMPHNFRQVVHNSQ